MRTKLLHRIVFVALALGSVSTLSAQLDRATLTGAVTDKTGAVVKPLRVGHNRSEDIAYSRGALWLATPRDNAVTKLSTSNPDPIPISVGQFPRQLTVSRDTVYVTNYNSSDLTMIDAKSSRVLGDPLEVSVSPFSLSVSADDKTLWVGSQPEDRLTKIATGRGG